MDKLLLAIDIGTSSCKIAVFKKDGTVVASNSQSYDTYYEKQGYVEQNPDEWWDCVCIAIKEVLLKGKINPNSIASIGVDGQSWSAIPINKDGKVLMNTPIWMDTRAIEICKKINQRFKENEIFEVSGNSLQPSYTTAKILWYKENYPQIYNEIYKILQSNSFIVYKLTNKVTQDKSQGYGLHCFDMRKGVWNEEICEKLDIPINFLPDIYECSEVVGTVTKKAAEMCGLVPGIPVVAGGLDAACGALGVGVINSGEAQEQGGQAGGMSICIDKYIADPRLILSYHVVPNLWLLQGGTTGGGGVMRWIENELAQYERSIENDIGKSSFEQLNDIANSINAGSDGVIFLPYMAGERSPIWNPHAKGVYYGLDFSKSKAHLVRAAMEGVAYSLKNNLDIAIERGADVKVLRAMGGAANSYLWTQIKSDVTGKEIVVPSSDTATTLGAAILAGIGVGLYKDFEDAVNCTIAIQRQHKPCIRNNLLYKNYYEKYLKIYESLKELMK